MILVCLDIQYTLAYAEALKETNNTTQDSSLVITENEISSRGLRISLISAPSYLFATGNDGTSSSRNYDSFPGVSIGYADLKVGQFGWTSNLAYLSLGEHYVDTFTTVQDNSITSGSKTYSGSINFVRADFNVAYTFNKYFNFKAGLNTLKCINGTGYDSGSENYFKNLGFGYQSSIGIQLTKNYGFDIGFSDMNFQGSNSNGSGNYTISGLEVALSGTF